MTNYLATFAFFFAYGLLSVTAAPRTGVYEDIITEGQLCPRPYGTFPDSEQCDAYWKCHNNTITKHLCPDGLAYDVKTRHCLILFSVNCQKRYKLQPARPSKNCPRQNGIFAHIDPQICSVFFQCDGGVSHEFKCPQPLVFSTESRTCQWPGNSYRTGCRDSKFGYAPEFNCSEAESDSSDIHPRFSDPKSCQHFYICLFGLSATRLSCQHGDVFNNATLACDLPENVPHCVNWYRDLEKKRVIQIKPYGVTYINAKRVRYESPASSRFGVVTHERKHPAITEFFRKVPGTREERQAGVSEEDQTHVSSIPYLKIRETTFTKRKNEQKVIEDKGKVSLPFLSVRTITKTVPSKKHKEITKTTGYEDYISGPQNVAFTEEVPEVIQQTRENYGKSENIPGENQSDEIIISQYENLRTGRLTDHFRPNNKFSDIAGLEDISEYDILSDDDPGTLDMPEIPEESIIIRAKRQEHDSEDEGEPLPKPESFPESERSGRSENNKNENIIKEQKLDEIIMSEGKNNRNERQLDDFEQPIPEAEHIPQYTQTGESEIKSDKTGKTDETITFHDIYRTKRQANNFEYVEDPLPEEEIIAEVDDHEYNSNSQSVENWRERKQIEETQHSEGENDTNQQNFKGRNLECLAHEEERVIKSEPFDIVELREPYPSKPYPKDI